MPSTTSSNTGTPTLTLADLHAAVERLRPLLDAPEPFAEWMRAQGHAPERGGRLVLPERLRAQCLLPPSYVSFSAAVDAPTLYYLAALDPLAARPWENSR